MIRCGSFSQPTYFHSHIQLRGIRITNGCPFKWTLLPFNASTNYGKNWCCCSNSGSPLHKKKKKKKKMMIKQKNNLKPISEREDGTKTSSLKSHKWNRSGKEEEENEEVESKVECKVEVISWRERQISASILIRANEQTVWDVLTDYERLADFIPNLVCSERIPSPNPGRIWVRQRGVQRALYWHIEAKVVLDLQEFPHLENGKELHFSMVDGDFKRYEGKWYLRSGPRHITTILSYEVNVIPRFNFPAIFVERIIRKDLPLNLQAVAARAEAKSGAILKMLPCQKLSQILPLETVQLNFHKQRESTFLVTRNSADSEEVKSLYHEMGYISESDEVEDDKSTATLERLSGIYLKDLANAINIWGTTRQSCSLDRPCVVDEVHLRRLDDLLENGGVHRRVIATITVKAPSRKVWKVLTAYENLPEFVPNLAISKIISRENNRVRLLQEGCKGLLYMVLHARIVLDLWEHPEHEILFEQVEGDFDSFRGKWILEQLGSQHTLLRYDVETKMRKNCLLAEAIVEEVIYKDLPSNLCALRDRVENKAADLRQSTRSSHAKGSKVQNNQYNTKEPHLKGKGETIKELKVSNDKPTKQRPKVPGLQRDIEILKYELSKFIKDHGQEGFMPMRKHLRLHGRVDLEKAITRMGGFRNIASLMNLSLSYKHRKPKGYWDSLENLKQEVTHFQRTWGMDPAYMPSRKSFERAGRYDLARAFEKWGGLHDVSRLLMLKLRHPRQDEEEDEDDDAFNSSHIQTPTKVQSCNNNGNNSNKWLRILHELDPNWVE